VTYSGFASEGNTDRRILAHPTSLPGKLQGLWKQIFQGPFTNGVTQMYEHFLNLNRSVFKL
jgi:hypothetical protein